MEAIKVNNRGTGDRKDIIALNLLTNRQCDNCMFFGTAKFDEKEICWNNCREPSPGKTLIDNFKIPSERTCEVWEEKWM